MNLPSNLSEKELRRGKHDETPKKKGVWSVTKRRTIRHHRTRISIFFPEHLFDLFFVQQFLQHFDLQFDSEKAIYIMRDFKDWNELGQFVFQLLVRLVSQVFLASKRWV